LPFVEASFIPFRRFPHGLAQTCENGGRTPVTPKPDLSPHVDLRVVQVEIVDITRCKPDTEANIRGRDQRAIARGLSRSTWPTERRSAPTGIKTGVVQPR
jgi:hypothetical protein